MTGSKAGKGRAETIGIIVRAAYRHEFHAAAGRNKWVREKRVLSRPTERRFEFGVKKSRSFGVSDHSIVLQYIREWSPLETPGVVTDLSIAEPGEMSSGGIGGHDPGDVGTG